MVWELPMIYHDLPMNALVSPSFCFCVCIMDTHIQVHYHVDLAWLN
jgi:hypothetical protein